MHRKLLHTKIPLLNSILPSFVVHKQDAKAWDSYFGFDAGCNQAFPSNLRAACLENKVSPD